MLVELLLTGVLMAQQIYVGPTDVDSPTWATPESFNSAEVPFCRGHYVSSRWEPNGGGWLTDHPGVDINLLVRLGELTTVRPGKAVVLKLDSPLLVQCPLLFLSDVGTMGLEPAEILGLRNYLLRGGMVWSDDFWGNEAWDQWMRTIKLVLPNTPTFDIPLDHPILHQHFDIPGIWQMPTNGLWVLKEDGTRETSERGEETLVPQMRGILDHRGRLVVVMTFNTDVADGMESAEWEESIDYFREFSHKSYALGVNIMLYSLTH